MAADITLIPFDERHLPALDDLATDPDVQRFTRLPVPVPPDFSRTWLAAYEDGGRASTREAFAIVEGDAFLGLALAPRIAPAERTAELGYVVAPHARGRGVATEALQQLTAWAFGQGWLRLELLISVENDASKQVAARAGYTHEGVLRSMHVRGDLREDLEIWSRLPGDPA